MSTVPTTFSRQAVVAVAGFLALFLLIVLWGTVYLVMAQDLQHEFERKSQTLDTLKRQTLSKLSTGGKIAQPAAREGVISAPSGTIAASELHKSVLASLEQAGGTVHSIQAETTSEVFGEGLRRLNAQTTFDGSTGALQRVLFELETAKPFVFIDSLHIQAGATAVQGTELGEMLRVTLVASSYWKSLDANTTH
jgi:hypothetical protein